MSLLPFWLVLTFAAAFGAVLGSFLNVVIVRLPLGQSIVLPASHCVSCGAPIRAYDNIPVLSYLWLRGRCRHCGARFSPRYALIEAAMAVDAVVVVRVFGPTWVALGFYVFLWLAVGIAAIDLEHWIIPHELSWTGIALGLIFSLVNPRAPRLHALLGAGIAWVVFTLMSILGEKIFKKEALGLGDRWLLAMEGAFLGPGALLPIVFLSSLQGSVVGLLLIVIGKAQTGQPKGDAARPPESEVEGKSEGQPEGQVEGKEVDPDADWVPPKNAIPFGPFLALAGVEWLFFGPAAWAWYAAKLAGALH